MSAQPEQEVSKLVDHLFRHEAGKMVSVLTRIFGVDHLELAEDVVQDTLLKALQQWSYKGIPDKPEAWLYRVAKNNAIDIIRREKHFNDFAAEFSYLLKSEYTLTPTVGNLFLENEIKDDQLRMMFTCCHPALAAESQVALTLKILCGFSVAEISKAFLTNEETITKRLYRAKEKFREEKISFEIPSGNKLSERLNVVLSVLYLLFNEGYNSMHPDILIRDNIIKEAIRLTMLLTEHNSTNLPATHALLSLMFFNSARIPSRLDDGGNILLLNEQNRNKWDTELNAKGFYHLDESARGDAITEYHLQAAIASYHNTSQSFKDTDWKGILHLYDLMIRMNSSPVIALNRAIVVAQIDGPQKGIDAINAINDIDKLDNYYLLHATLGELYMQAGNPAKAKTFLNKAISLTSSNAEKELIKRKLENAF